ncbi:MAG: guanylyltransferase [Planctomycetes bacterium SCN 63-9]|nr:MAG: guanylyltransferase [Planctomycetes bacterium SCN 63-9]
MTIDELDRRMRAFESVLDPIVMPGVFMVARLDGRNFTRLTKELHPFEAPFDRRFHEYMLKTADHLMSGCGLKVVYGFTQSDEISLLVGPDDGGFGRRLRKLLSILSGEASAKFSILLGATAAFDCRISQLPSIDLVIDYFRWRAEDAHRNALNAHCYWLLRRQGRDIVEATEGLRGLSTSAKNELLFRGGINFGELPSWQKRGSGLSWEEYERRGENALTGEEIVARRRRIRHEPELPVKDAYSAFLRDLISKTEGCRGQVA